MKKTVIAIIANGRPPAQKLISENLKDVDIIIAADGGANACKDLNITPDFIVGDLDSVTEETKEYFSGTSVIPMLDQNYSDMQKSIAFALTHNPKKLKIFAAFGMRSDHTFSNLLVLEEMEIPVPFEVFDNYGTLTLLHAGKHSLAGKPGQPVSLLSLRPIKMLSLSGFKYSVKQRDDNPFFNGTSNQFIRDEAIVEFDSGRLFVYLPFWEES